MPLDYCHPTAPHKKLRLPEWYVSSLMMDRALDAICRRVKKLDRSHDIPYLAGYSLDGKTIYIDRHMPQSFKFRGRTIDTDRFLILHEEVEKTLIDQLGLHYLHAHQIATRAEEAAVRAAGIALARLRRVHAEIRQEHRRRAAHQGAGGPRSQALSRRARRRSAAPHAEERARRKGAERHSCPRPGAKRYANCANACAGTIRRERIAPPPSRPRRTIRQTLRRAKDEREEKRQEEKVIACRRQRCSVRRKSRHDAVGPPVCRDRSARRYRGAAAAGGRRAQGLGPVAPFRRLRRPRRHRRAGL